MRFGQSLGFAVLLVLVAAAGCGGGGGNPGTSSGAPPVLPPAANALFTTAPASLITSGGASLEFAISGGVPPYTGVSNDAAVAIAGVNGLKLTIGGVASGVADVSVRDAVGMTVSTSVTVKSATLRPLFTTALPNVVISIGAASAQTYTIGGGTGPYTATSSNVGVAAVALTGSGITVNGLAAGTANIVVRDSAGVSITTAVTVQATNNVALFTTAPPSVTVAIGASPTYTIGGGSGSGYLATSNNAGVASVGVSGSTLTVTGVTVGSAIVVARDSTGATATFNVTVGTSSLAVTPGNATGIISDVLIATVIGGTPPYKASVGNNLVATAVIQNSNELRIRLLQVGQTIVTVLDANNQSVAYTLTANAATPGIRLSPGAVTISEFDTQPILFTVFGAAPGVTNVFSSDVTRLTATIVNDAVTVTTGTSGNRCVDADLALTITVIDSTRASGVANVTIKDNALACPKP